MGVHSGRVLLGGGVEGVQNIRGNTVNRAARMEQSAPSGAMHIGQNTWRLVRGLFVAQAQAPSPLQVNGAWRCRVAQQRPAAWGAGCAPAAAGTRARHVAFARRFCRRGKRPRGAAERHPVGGCGHRQVAPAGRLGPVANAPTQWYHTPGRTGQRAPTGPALRPDAQPVHAAAGPAGA